MTGKRGRSKPEVRRLVVISDTHCGCAMGLCPPSFALDDGGEYQASRLQRVVWGWWEEFWGEFVPHATRGEPYAIVHNGDVIDGSHHKGTTQITHNIGTQRRIAEVCLRPHITRAAAYYHIRGTEVHIGQSGEDEEAVARALGAKPDGEGRHAQWEFRATIGNRLIHFTHHISTSTSPYAESGGLMREIVNMYVECGQSGDRPVDLIVRSHRHRTMEVTVPGKHGKCTAIATPAWQLKTPYVFRTGARLTQPQIGGVVISLVDDELFTRTFVKRITPPKEVRLG